MVSAHHINVVAVVSAPAELEKKFIVRVSDDREMNALQSAKQPGNLITGKPTSADILYKRCTHAWRVSDPLSWNCSYSGERVIV
jgi:hypothetical protein